jgi:predicted adenine nucleotide alpha hydrolase (AANH) superfamily ATPase
MAVGETIVGTLWASFAGICIEKLLDELLKVNIQINLLFLFPNIFFRMELIKKNLHQKNLKMHYNLQQVQHHHHQ